MALTNGDWINLALCAAIVAILTLAYNIDPASTTRHTQDAPHQLLTMTTPAMQPQSIMTGDGAITVAQAPTPSQESEPTTTTNIHHSAVTVDIEHILVKEARYRPRLVKVCDDGKCEKRWAVTI